MLEALARTSRRMLFTMEGAMRSLRLGALAAGAVLGTTTAASAPDDNNDGLTTATTDSSTSTVTVTTSITRTITLTRAVTSSVGIASSEIASSVDTSLGATSSSLGISTGLGTSNSLGTNTSIGTSTSLATSTSLGISTSLAVATSVASASPAATDMTSQGKTYVLQGCFAYDGARDIGLVLGQDYTTPEPEASDMSLSLCLQLCASAVTGGSTTTYPYVGVADGSSCYCGTALNATLPQASVNDCTLPCAGSDTEACGGQGYMSVYKLTLVETVAPATSTASANRASSVNSASSSLATPSAAQTDSPNAHGSGATFQENKDTDTSGSKSPGTITGIAVGSVAGVGSLLFLVFLAAKWLLRRRQIQAAGATRPQKEEKGVAASYSTATVETISATVNTHDAASIRDAKRVDLRRLDGVVMDQYSPSPGFAYAGTTKENKRIGVAATTGVEWKTNSRASPLTPRTPRHVDAFGEEIEQRGSSTPSIVVHPPDNIAPNYGLGERAWHRRRLSMDYAAPVAETGAAAAAAVVDDRRRLPSYVSSGSSAGGVVDARTLREDEVVSALSENRGMAQSPSWQWTLSTVTEDEHDRIGKKA